MRSTTNETSSDHTSPVSTSLLIPATPQNRRYRHSLAKKESKKSFKRPPKQTYSDDSLLEDAKRSSIDGYTIVTVRDQSCSTSQLENLCSTNNGNWIEDEVQSEEIERDPTPKCGKPDLVERGCSALFVLQKYQSTSIEPDYRLRNTQKTLAIVSKQTSYEDLTPKQPQSNLKRIPQMKPPSTMITTSDFYNTDDNYCQTEYNTDDNYCPTGDFEDLLEEKEKLQNLMHMIPAPVTTAEEARTVFSNSSSSSTTTVPSVPRSKCSRSLVQPMVTVAQKTNPGLKCKIIDPRKLVRCYKCKKCVPNATVGKNGLDKSSSYYKSSMCSCPKPRVKRSLQSKSDQPCMKVPHPKYEVIVSPVATPQCVSRRSKCERWSQKVDKGCQSQSRNVSNNSNRQCVIHPCISNYDMNENTDTINVTLQSKSSQPCMKAPHPPNYEVVASPVSTSQCESRRSKCDSRSQKVGTSCQTESHNISNNSSWQCVIHPCISNYEINGNTDAHHPVSTRQCSSIHCEFQNPQQTCSNTNNTVIPLTIVSPEPDCDCSTCAEESKKEKKLVASCNFVFQFK